MDVFINEIAPVLFVFGVLFDFAFFLFLLIKEFE